MLLRTHLEKPDAFSESSMFTENHGAINYNETPSDFVLQLPVITQSVQSSL